MTRPTQADCVEWASKAAAEELRPVVLAVANGSGSEAKRALDIGTERMLQRRLAESFLAGIAPCHDTSCRDGATDALHGPHGVLYYCARHARAYSNIMGVMGASVVSL